MSENILEDNWSISHEDYSMNHYDHKAYHKIWSQLFKEKLIDYGSSTLLINDADQIFYSSISQPTYSTIVDPYSYLFTESKYKRYLSTTSFVDTIDSLGYTRKLVLIDETFNSAEQDGCFNTKYDLIFVNAKSPEELKLSSIEKYFLLLKSFGILCIQVNEDLFNQQNKSYLEHYFTELSDKARTSNATGKINYFITYRKISQLI